MKQDFAQVKYFQERNATIGNTNKKLKAKLQKKVRYDETDQNLSQTDRSI